MDYAIKTENLRKNYGRIKALKGLNLSVSDGEVFGFLGPNGAGKTTTIKILLDFIRPSNGFAEILGLDSIKDSLEIKKRVGYLPEVSSVYGRLSGKRHVEFAKETKNADTDVDEVLERVGLGDSANRKAGGYSKGMKQRLLLAIALVGDPDLLILDEPTTGLDPNGARMVREIVKEENNQGKTVFFSSHILEQVEEVADRVGILKAGELITEDTIEGLRDQVGSTSILKLKVSKVPDLNKIKEIEGVSDVKFTNKKLEIESSKDLAKSKVINLIEEMGVEIYDLRTEDSSLDDLFAVLTRGKI